MWERGRRHVNRKALDQWTSFTEERERLRRRQGENARGEAKIRELIKTLDMRKDEAIERTFKARRPRRQPTWRRDSQGRPRRVSDVACSRSPAGSAWRPAWYLCGLATGAGAAESRAAHDLLRGRSGL